MSVLLSISGVEAAHLDALLAQFSHLLAADGEEAADPALARLVPDAYPGDAASSREFRDVTQRELLARRTAEAAAMRADLREALDRPDADAVGPIALDDDAVAGWLRTLAALRLVLASRMGIVTEDDHDPDDPRFAVYEWLGYRLDALVRAADET